MFFLKTAALVDDCEENEMITGGIDTQFVTATWFKQGYGETLNAPISTSALFPETQLRFKDPTIDF